MDKLKMHTPNRADDNFKKLAALFPNAVTETINENGEVVRAIDKDVLMQEISCTVVDGKEERYQFTWPDKKKSMLLANAPLSKTLRPCRVESVDFDNTENLYVEGDNLEVLKLLQETYLGKIKMIYIDPPYNTGNDFLYEDDFAQSTGEYLMNSGQYDDVGNQLVANLDSNGRFHTDWLNMIYPRLRIAKDLLTEDGVIFISIDDNEVFNLKKICDEIFGSTNFVVQFAVQLNPRGRNLDLFVAKTHESVLVYAKNYLQPTTMFGVEKEGKMVDEYNKEDEVGKYRAIGLRNRNQSFNPQTRPNLYFPLYVDPKTQKVSTVKDGTYTDEVWPDAPDGTKTCWTWMRTKVEKENNLVIAERSGDEWRIFRKDYLMSEDGSVATTLVKSLWTDNTINNDYGKKSIKELFGGNIMSFPKSPELIKKLIMIGMQKNDIIMDFFSGSATTAHAVMQLNAEDNGTRKFIMVQLPEEVDEKSDAYKAGYKNICEIGKERLRRAGAKVKADSPLTTQGLDVGFRVLKCDTSNMKDVYYSPADYELNLLDLMTDNIKADRTPEDLLFQIMLELGVELSSKIEETVIAGKKVFDVADGFLIACFDADVTDETIKAIAQKQPYYFVMRDSSLANDSVATNFEQIFATYSPDTVRKVL